jgi:hypothetical protein
MSPPIQVYSQDAAVEHRAAAMTSYVEARSRVIGNTGSNSVIDLSQDMSSFFSDVITGCTYTRCIDLKSGVIYKMKCYNCVCLFKSTPK